MQSFAGANAKLCVGSCKALRLRQAITGTDTVCLILNKRKGRKVHPTGHCSPRKFLLNHKEANEKT